jgi:Ribbon-helix-helix protein, copG family
VKLSVSISEADVALLDEYARGAGLGSRSAAVQHAIRLLRHADLEQDYALAWDEWDAADRGVWERATGDGLS